MHAVRRPRRVGWPRRLAGDRGYSFDGVRDFLHGCGIEPVIPRRRNQPCPKHERFDRRSYRKRCRVEQAVGWLKAYRRLGTRYEKLALNFLAFVKLGIVLRYLRILSPSDRT
jgi:transposase